MLAEALRKHRYFTERHKLVGIEDSVLRMEALRPGSSRPSGNEPGFASFTKMWL